MTRDSRSKIEPLMVVAFGGNAMMRAGESGDPEQQVANARAACAPLVERIVRGARMVIVHGNGPQVGLERKRRPAPRLDVCVAATQGTMGYFIELALRDALRKRGVQAKLATLTTLVRVSPDDPAFRMPPEKRIGPIAVDAPRVPSPLPREILDIGAIGALVDAGYVVVAAGGGGIPVVRGTDGRLVGIEAVIDKDHTAALIAHTLGARELVDLTAVDFVYRDFGTPRATPLPTLTLAEARRMHAAGQFPPGNMGPKITAACSFLEGGGESVLVSSMARFDDALRGEVGTRIVRSLS